MCLQVTRFCTFVSETPRALERARAEFEAQHCLRLPQFLAPDLLRQVQRGLDRGEFIERTHKEIGVELCLHPDTTSALLAFLANDLGLFRVIRQITGCGPIESFDGRVYRMLPGGCHYDSWHDDATKGRMIAMSINLSMGTYTGGVLEIRNAVSKEILHRVANVGLGDAILFRISPQLEHQVTPLDGTEAKTAYAGWFRTEPGCQARLREAISRSQLAATS
jgi:2OG-Fe(II) oxygenase superfamily